jgi:hypothetical protein
MKRDNPHKVELHLHTSRYSGCAVHEPVEILKHMAAIGYETVFITEHDAVWPDAELEEIRRQVPELQIFPGMELTVGPSLSCHMLVLGTNDPAYLPLTVDPRRVIDRAREQSHLTVLAHPARFEDPARVLQSGAVPDAIEHKTTNHEIPAQCAEAARWARKLGIAMVNAGDVHAVEQVGRYWIELDEPLESPRHIRDMVLAGRYRCCER